MKEGDVVLTPIPQADGVVKNRPTIVLRAMPPYGDLLVAGISTQLDKEVKGFDEVISSNDEDFSDSGLRTIKSGSGSVDVASALKFKQGVHHFFQGNLDAFGS